MELEEEGLGEEKDTFLVVICDLSQMNLEVKVRELNIEVNTQQIRQQCARLPWRQNISNIWLTSGGRSEHIKREFKGRGRET